MPTKAVKNRLRDRVAVVFLCLGLGTFGIGGVLALESVSGEAEAIKDAQLFACQRGNETRAALRREKNSEIAFIETIPKLVKAPPGVLDKYVETQKHLVEENRDKIFVQINCEKEIK